MQTILGAGGGIGIPLAKELTKFTSKIRLVGRNPKKVNETDQLFAADMNDKNQIIKAIEGSSVVYVTIGFPYSLKVWQKQWPPFVETVIEGCKSTGSNLVFFDNMYMYSKDNLAFMTEKSKIDPPSRKGEVRKQIAQRIMDEAEKGTIEALIVRAADFYGPDNRNSMLTISAAQNLLKSKKAQAFGDLNCIHTYTYTPDAALATALLGNTPDAFNQIWHAPTTKQKLTNRDWIELIAKEIGKEPKIQTVPAWMIKMIGLFVPIMREFPEMLYQYELDYVFDSSKFEKRFDILATTPEEGIKVMMNQLKGM